MARQVSSRFVGSATHEIASGGPWLANVRPVSGDPCRLMRTLVWARPRTHAPRRRSSEPPSSLWAGDDSISLVCPRLRKKSGLRLPTPSLGPIHRRTAETDIPVRTFRICAPPARRSKRKATSLPCCLRSGSSRLSASSIPPGTGGGGGGGGGGGRGGATAFLDDSMEPDVAIAASCVQLVFVRIPSHTALPSGLEGHGGGRCVRTPSFTSFPVQLFS